MSADPSLIPGWSPTQWIALYAAFVATGTLIWNIYKDGFRDRAKLKLSIGMRELVGSGRTEHDVLVFKITNDGGKPIRVTHVCVKGTGKTNYMIVDDALPKKIEPGDYHHTLCRDYGFSGVAGFFVEDSLGRQYFAPKKNLTEAKRELADLKAKGITKSWFGNKRGD